MNRAGWMAALCMAAWGWGGVQAGDLPIRRIVRDSLTRPEPRSFVGPGAMVGHVPSRRNVLKLKRSHPLGLPTAESAVLLKTVRVAVLRVQFALETPDDPRTTGNGHLDLRDSAVFFAEEGHAFETAPHNRDFFNTVMRAMTQYYNVISNGRLIVNYDVFPTARDSAYTLDSSMCAYGSLPPNEGLAYLLIDAAIKADPDLAFSNYDHIVIFHAGSDAQHDFSPITPSPCDLYTGFVRLLDSNLFVPVDGGAAFVEEAVILPETATQDNRGTGLNGMVAHEFGHALGLVDLYSTRTGTTQVGDFSLMDNDAQQVGIEFGVPWSINTFFDLLPVFPDAWSRAYLGFIDPVVATPDSILARDHADPDSVRPYIVNAAEHPIATSQILKVPISSREYYLAEFRTPDQDRNANASVPGDQGVGIRFDSSFNAVLGPSTCNPTNPNDSIEVDTCRVFGRDYDFQFFQPGEPGGLLIWHVDEEVAYQSVPEVEADPFLLNNFDANTLQWDRFRRFIEVEEADGLVDFGGNYFTYYGGQRELFLGSGNNEFGPSTNPSTRSHTGAPSGLRLFDISPVPPPVPTPLLNNMILKVRRESAVRGWPRAAGPSGAPQLAVISGGGTDTILATSGRYILGWRADGTSLLTQGTTLLDSIPKFDQTPDTLRLSGWAQCDTTLATAPSVGTDQGGGLRYVSATDVNGRVYIWAFTDSNADGWADTVSTHLVGSSPPQPPVWFDSDGNGREELFVASGSGNGAYFDGSAWSDVACGSAVRDWCLAQPGNRLFLAADDGLSAFTAPTSVSYTAMGRQFRSLLAMDSDRDGTDELFARDTLQLHRIDISSAPRIVEANDPRFIFHGPLTAGDHDGDGRPSVFCGAGDRQTAFQPNLTLETGFPLRANDYYPGDPVTEAVVVDRVVFFGGADGEVQGYLPDRSFLPGWPFFAGDTVVSVAAMRSSADSVVVLARSTTGTIWAQKAAARSDLPGAWAQSRGNAAKTNRWEGTGVVLPSPGTASLPKESVFAYPNPAARGPVAIRYYLGESSTVELRIYDLAGNEITRSQTSGTGGMDNEWIWEASGIAPGVYFCRVQATQGGKEVVEFCKVAIAP